MLNTTIVKIDVVDDLTDQVDGLTSSFSTSEIFDPNTLYVFLNGLKQRFGIDNDYVINSNNEIVMNDTPLSGDSLIVEYIKI